MKGPFKERLCFLHGAPVDSVGCARLSLSGLTPSSES